MTFRPAVGPRLVAAGIATECVCPAVVCDGCGVVHEVRQTKQRQGPPLWWVEGRAPPRWEKVGGRNDPSDDAPARHYCPCCKIARRVEGLTLAGKGGT